MATKTPSTASGVSSPVRDVAQDDAVDRGRHVGTGDVGELGIPAHLDLGVLEQPVLQDALGAEFVAAVDDGHLAREVGEEQRLLDGGVAAADHDHFLVAVEEAVAGGAGRDAEALELLLGRQAEPARLRAGRDDQRVGGVDRAAVADAARTGGGRSSTSAMMSLTMLGADMLGLRLHLLHQPGALDDVGKAGIVLDIGGDGELAAGLQALDDDRLEHGARGIDRRRVAGRARADDDDLGVHVLGLSPGRPAKIGAARRRFQGKPRIAIGAVDLERHSFR